MEHYPYQSPKQLEALIKKSIIGQDEGVRTVATALAAHLLRIEHNQNHPDDLLHKDNLLIIGPTGSGKTESIRTVTYERGPIPEKPKSGKRFSHGQEFAKRHNRKAT